MLLITLQDVYFYAKMVGATGAATGAIYGGIKWLKSAYNELKSTNDNVALLMTNHLPHLQASLNEHGQSLVALSSDVRYVVAKVNGMEKRSEDAKDAMHTLSESFIRHLESAAVTPARKRARKV